MVESVQTIVLCSCDDTMPLDAGAVRRGCRGAKVEIAGQLVGVRVTRGSTGVPGRRYRLLTGQQVRERLRRRLVRWGCGCRRGGRGGGRWWGWWWLHSRNLSPGGWWWLHSRNLSPGDRTDRWRRRGRRGRDEVAEHAPGVFRRDHDEPRMQAGLVAQRDKRRTWCRASGKCGPSR